MIWRAAGPVMVAALLMPGASRAENMRDQVAPAATDSGVSCGSCDARHQSLRALRRARQPRSGTPDATHPPMPPLPPLLATDKDD